MSDERRAAHSGGLPWNVMIHENQQHEDPQIEAQLDLLRHGGDQAVADLFQQVRPQLERMVNFRMDRRLVGRVDAADILQEAYLEVARRVNEYLQSPTCSFFVWARQITWQRLLTVHRAQLGAQKRDAGREVHCGQLGPMDATSISLASMLVGDATSPSQAAMRNERADRLRAALESMELLDREVLALRHFEQLSNQDVSAVLQISKTAASNRYVRALDRLRELLQEVPEQS